ncbi:MAG: TatD family hydrolase [Actinomycetota bacterium]
MLVDTHCHLDMLEDLDGALTRMRAAGVGRAVTIGVHRASSEWAVRAARTHHDVWATVGLHPHDAKSRTDEVMALIERLAGEERVVGVGEAGLDYHYDNSPRDVQRVVFAEQVALARRSGKALVIHTREAWDDTFAILDSEGAPERTVFHCFSGGPAEARRALDVGAVLSFSGVVTFRNAAALRDAVRVTPLDRIVVETDSPFLTPVPHRGRPNEPGYVRYVAEAIAAEKGLAADEIARLTSENAAWLFGWS